MLEEPLDRLSMKRGEELLFSSLDVPVLVSPSISASGFTLQFTAVNHFAKKRLSLTVINVFEQGRMVIIV